MKAIQKRKQVKPAMEFATDINIILECLYEVYGQEAHHVLKGRDIQKTMVFSFPEDVSESVRWNFCKRDA